MLYQDKRSLCFLFSNILISSIYILGLAHSYGARIAMDPVDRVFLASAILIYIPVQILIRLIVIIVFAIVYKMQTDETTVEIEDEMDKLVDLKATSVFFVVFVTGLILGLVSQAAGLSLRLLFLGIGATFVVSSLIGDCVTLAMYRRGV
jgi:hypothetical protein